MGSLNGRVRRLEDILEGAVGTPSEAEREARRRETEEKRAALAAKLRRIREQAEREEAETGDDRRRRALEDLEEHMRRRVEGRSHGGA